MIEKLFGETPEEQYQYLKPRLLSAFSFYCRFPLWPCGY